MRLPQLRRNKPLLFGAAAAALLVPALMLMLSHRPAPTPVPITQPVAVALPSPALDAKSTTILELFNPSDDSLTHQLNETSLSQRIEHIWLTSFVLARCDLLSEQEYRDTFRALIAYAVRMGLAQNAATAEARVREIAVSASASYSLVYHRTPCDHASLPIIAQQLATWRTAYLK